MQIEIIIRPTVSQHRVFYKTYHSTYIELQVPVFKTFLPSVCICIRLCACISLCMSLYVCLSLCVVWTVGCGGCWSGWWQHSSPGKCSHFYNARAAANQDDTLSAIGQFSRSLVT